MFNWLVTYRAKLSRRNLRIKGFTFRFLLPRYIKSLLLLPSLLGLIGFIFLAKGKTIIYRPDIRHHYLLENLSQVLVIGTISDASWARTQGYDFFHFSPIYTACNFGLSVWHSLLKITCAKRVLIWTDYGLDQYLAINTVADQKIKIWCVQHGLFPATNNKDLDGMDSHVNVVASLFQKKILLQAGYTGKVLVNQSLFQKSSSVTQHDCFRQWTESGKRVIFVGAGYNHDSIVENRIFNLILQLKEALPKCTLIYRPHPRDNAILKKLMSIDLSIESDSASAIEGLGNFVFVGIKSTYLLEAQNFGKCAILITGKNFSRYFEPGEIDFEVADSELHNLEHNIESYMHKRDTHLHLNTA
jgi:hypothetical protein